MTVTLKQGEAGKIVGLPFEQIRNFALSKVRLTIRFARGRIRWFKARARFGS
jgi:hypothetical protein